MNKVAWEGTALVGMAQGHLVVEEVRQGTEELEVAPVTTQAEVKGKAP